MPKRLAVYVLNPYHEDAIALLRAASSVDVVLPNDTRQSRLPWYEHADGVLVRSESHLSANDFAKAKAAGKLRAVVKQGVGYDNIDANAARAAGIGVYNTPGVNSEAVAEHSLALALSLARRVTELDRRARRGEKIVRSEMLGVSLFQKTVGIVGMGHIGKAAAIKWLGGCQSRIIGYDPVAPPDIWDQDRIPHTRAQTLDNLLTESDVVTLHLPLLDSTRGLVGAEQLRLMKKTAILINASRGGIVDEEALLAAVREGRIWGAVLDAMEVEPATVQTHKDWFELDNVIITPHVGASTKEIQSLAGITAVKTLLAVLEGEEDYPGKRVV